MRIKVRQIGNSKGIIIPYPFLNECDIVGEVEVRLEGKSIVIQAPSSPRDGWFDGYNQKLKSSKTEKLWDELPIDVDDGEWEW